MTNDPLPIALKAVRNRAAALADAINAAGRAQQQLKHALDAAEEAGATNADIAQQVKLAVLDRPDRENALERLALLDNHQGA